MVFEITEKETIFNMEEFCRLNNELKYIGKYADKKTSQVIGTIVQHSDKFYTIGAPGIPGIYSYPAGKEDMVTTAVMLCEIVDYIPEEYKPLDSCPIRIIIWNIDIDGECPIVRYAFYDEQLEEAKEVVNSHEDVDIFIDGVQIAIKDFLAY